MFLPANDAGEVSHAVIKLRMITMMKHVASLAFMLAAGPAFGQSLPSFSIEKHCQSYGGDSDYCVQRTQEIYGPLHQLAQCLANWLNRPREKKIRKVSAVPLLLERMTTGQGRAPRPALVF